MNNAIQFLVCMLFWVINIAFGQEIRLGFHKDFSGIGNTHVLVLNGRCTNIPHILNDKITSIDPAGECVNVFRHHHCRGGSIEIKGNPVTDLDKLGFNDKISSMKLCESLPFRKVWSFKPSSLKEPMMFTPKRRCHKGRAKNHYVKVPLKDQIIFV